MSNRQNSNIVRYSWKTLICVGIIHALCGISTAYPHWNVSNMCGVRSETSFENPHSEIEIGNLPYSWNASITNDLPTKAVVELAIFCDRNFSAIFNYNALAIRKYWTSYLLDTTLRYRTVINAEISFLISTIVVFMEHEQQPFIEEAIADNGTISVNKTSQLFSRWVYSMMDSIPRFDIAVAVTSLEPNDEGGIVGGIGTACFVDHQAKIHYGTAVIVDYGMSYVLLGAHELGHLLGAYHDEEIDSFPECSEAKFIMNNGRGNNSEEKQYFFSSCSSRLISNFIRSNGSECLRRIDNPKSRLSDIEAPSRLEQCKRILPGNGIFVKDDNEICSHTQCYWYEGTTLKNKSISLVDNTPCNNGNHCFRDHCIRIGQALQNIEHNICIRAESQFNSTDKLTITSCSQNQDILTSLEKFGFTPGRNGGYIISTPYSNVDFSKSGEKCIFATYNDELVLLEKCSEMEESWMIWDRMLDTQRNAFLLKHRDTARCVKLDGKSVTVVSQCDVKDASQMWRFLVKDQ